MAMRSLVIAVVMGLLSLTVSTVVRSDEPAVAIFAGGCFWCVEHDFRQLQGVLNAVSGYTGGSRTNPTYANYHEVDAANPIAHVEAVKITYDPGVVSFERLLDYYFRHIDPTDGAGQFCDRGAAYRPVVFVKNEAERAAAKAKKASVAKLLKRPIRVEIANATRFWPAEDYHQRYSEKNRLKYRFYRLNCGRDERLKELWGRVSG